MLPRSMLLTADRANEWANWQLEWQLPKLAIVVAACLLLLLLLL